GHGSRRAWSLSAALPGRRSPPSGNGRAVRGPAVKRLAWALCVFAAIAATPRAQQNPAAAGRVRTYYIAAEETDWNYAPLGIDMMTGKPFEGTSAAYTQPGPDHIGNVYRKALYREYTDATFATRKARAPEDDYLGLLGPILRA